MLDIFPGLSHDAVEARRLQVLHEHGQPAAPAIAAIALDRRRQIRKGQAAQQHDARPPVHARRNLDRLKERGHFQLFDGLIGGSLPRQQARIHRQIRHLTENVGGFGVEGDKGQTRQDRIVRNQL